MTPAPDATSPASQVGMGGPLGRNETKPPERLCGHGPDDGGVCLRCAELQPIGQNAPIPAVQSGAVAWITRQIELDQSKAQEMAESSWVVPSSNAARIANEAVRRFAAPRSEPLPGGVGEATPEMIAKGAWRARLAHDANPGAAWEYLAAEVYAVMEAVRLSGKEQG